VKGCKPITPVVVAKGGGGGTWGSVGSSASQFGSTVQTDLTKVSQPVIAGTTQGITQPQQLIGKI
jgi:hypothetical protein